MPAVSLNQCSGALRALYERRLRALVDLALSSYGTATSGLIYSSGSLGPKPGDKRGCQIISTKVQRTIPIPQRLIEPSLPRPSLR
jgi:hypothetical protein